MSNELVTGDLFPENNPGGASDRRGTAHYTELAKFFVKDFPIGTDLSAALIDQWLHDRKELVVPPEGVAKSSDQWLGHLQRRHIIIGRINKSSTHPRMRDQGSVAFVIIARGGKFQVKAPHEVIVQGELPKKVLSVCVTGRKKLRYLMESADWTVLPPFEKAMAESIDDDIDLFEEHIGSSARSLETKLAKLDGKIRRGLASGEIVPIKEGGGISGFLSGPAEEENGTQA